MKKLFLLAAGLALTLTACQKDEGVVSDTTSSSSFTVTIPQNGTRAVTDDFGAGTSANRCILEIYCNDKLYNRIEKGVTGETVTFDDLRLVAQQTYDFVFWADCAEGSEGSFTDKTYNTANLKSITEIGPFVGNSDERDAFFAHETFEVTGSFSRPVTLKRPFGLLVVKTNDLNEIRDEALKPTGYEVAFKGLPTTFNALTGEVSGSADVSYKATEFAKTDGTISMDFLWATESGAALSDFTMTFYNGGTEICTNDAFTNIPIRRNYRTNVSGNLLTRKGTISVTIDPEFEGDIPQDVDQVKDIAAANEAFAKGKTNVVVTDAPTEEATLVLPSTTAPVSATLPALTTKLKVQYSSMEGAQKPVSFNLTASSSAAVEIETAASTVSLAGTSYADVTATTAANTLIVSEETTIDKLTVKSGNVEVYGTVKAIASKPAAATVTLHASTAAKLQEFAAGVKTGTNLYNKIVLDADINFKDAAFQIGDARNIEFDGQGHKLSNYKEENTQTAGLVCNAVSVTFRNLIVENAAVKAVNDGNGNAYAGVFVGRSYGTTVFDNCQAVNSTVEGVNKVGGMIGFVAENHIEATGCKVVGCTISNIDVTEESGQIGGFAGYLGNLYNSTCSFTNCSVENSAINAYMNREDRTISKFIGCFQGDQATDIVSIDNCSVKNVALKGMNEMAQSFVSTYGDLLGGQRYGKGTVKITNSDTDIHISTRGQLAALASMVNAGTSFAQKTIKLAGDIDLESKEWTPIGTTGKAFQGIFDGCGHTISNLKIARSVSAAASSSDIGLFGYTSNGEIRNFTLRNASVKGGLNVGAIAGTPFTSKYSDITLTGTVQIDGYSYVGGMFGKNLYKSANNLMIRADKGSYVKAQSETYRTYVGGVVGFMGEGNNVLSNVESNIDVIGSTCDVGGITGIAHYGNTFENCVCTGNVTLVHANDAGDQLEIGGIAGVWMNSTAGSVTFRNCRFDGTLSSNLNGEDRSAEVAGNRITGRKYSPNSNDGELIIE